MVGAQECSQGRPELREAGGRSCRGPGWDLTQGMDILDNQAETLEDSCMDHLEDHLEDHPEDHLEDRLEDLEVLEDHLEDLGGKMEDHEDQDLAPDLRTLHCSCL